MNSKRSYLDTVNAGRQRRTYTSLEQLNRSLETLEQRLERNREEASTHMRDLPRHPHAPSLTERTAAAQPKQEAPGHHQLPYDALARDIERVRKEEDGVAAFGEIAGELTSLREELRRKMASGLRQEFDSVREKFHQINAHSGQTESKLGLDVERLSKAVRSLGERSFEDFEDRAATQTRPDLGTAEISALNERIDQIGRAIGNLPESLPLRTLDEKVRTLASALNHFIEHQDGRASELFSHIEERLDEISRAIVGATIARQHLDPEPFERIEARISALARQIEEITEDRKEADTTEHLQVLIRRVDELVARSALPEEAIEQLVHHISALADKISQTPAPQNADDIFLAIDQRFAAFAQSFENERHGITDEAIRNLESRLDGISKRLDESASQFTGIDPELVRSLEAQVAGLSEHLSRPSAPLPEFVDISPRLKEIERSIAESRESVLEAARAAAETAVLSLAERQPGAASDLAREVKALEELTRRSDERNSKTFEAIHDTLLKIVDRMGTLELEKAAETNIPAENDAPSRQEQKLEVQETPGIDAQDAFETADPKLLTNIKEASIAAEDPHIETDVAKAADSAPDQPEEQDQNSSRVRSMFGSLTRAFSRKPASDEKEPELPGSSLPVEPSMALAPEIDLDATIDPKLANRPLEPGSGTPDLNAILKRVRDERSPMIRHNETDAGKSDFIAAARRAAQAAAAEAESRKRKTETEGSAKTLRIGGLLKSRRKHLLLGATALMTALAALHFGKSMLHTEEIAGLTVNAPMVQTASADIDSGEPADPAPMADIAETEAQSMPTARIADTPEASLSEPLSQESIDAAFAPYDFPEAGTGKIDGGLTDNVKVSAISPIGQIDLEEEAKSLADALQTDIGPAPLREAAVAGDPLALFEIGSRYAEGRGVKADMAEAAKWYEQAADAGFPPAQYLIGNMYEKGLGVQRDLSAARRWYEQAAQAGNASAMHNLAVLYAMGVDGQSDNDDAAKWFIKAAELGVKDSQFNLGILSAKGAGTKQSLEESYKWFALVAKTGDKDAEGKRDEIGKALRPEQLERARAAAELWKPKPLDAAANTASIPDSWQTDAATTASIGTTLPVKSVQQLLNEKGYDAGSADGVMGSKTKDAIAQFQADHGLAPTGKVDENLTRALTAIN